MANMWMVRAGKHARYFKEFKEQNIVSIEWDFDDLSDKNFDDIKDLIKNESPRIDSIALGTFAFQINSFVNTFKIEDFVITFDPEHNVYLIGKIISNYYYSHNNGLKHFRDVEWLCEVKKDEFKESTLKTLRTGNAVFQINPNVKRDIFKTVNSLNSELFLDDANDIDHIDDEKSGIGDSDVKTTRYWVYSPGIGAEMWDEFYRERIMGIGWPELGNLSQYDEKEQIQLKLKRFHKDNLKHVMDTHAVWQFANEMKEGDVIFAKKGMSEIIGRGIVESDYVFDEKWKYYPNIRKVNWTHKGNWPYEKGKFPSKTLTDITNYKEDIDYINELISDEELIDNPKTDDYPEYLPEKFLEEVYISEGDYWTLRNLLVNKKNLIVQGAPGVGKTFMAKRLAYSIMGIKDADRVMMVQFHQSYSYEDFIMGYRPYKDGFELKKGSFYKFCKDAEEDSENDYFFIIDEINRGNLSKIFGELFMLIENDKRGEKNKIQLVYSDESFFIPKNVYIIGLMNTADRSLAMIDYALRRRFAFFDLKPGFDSDGFKNYQSKLDDSKFDGLIEVMKELNHDIKDDESLGEGFRIGHSYLCNIKSGDVGNKLNYIVEYELIPLLKEYWFDESEKVNYWSDRLRSVLDDS